MQYHGSRRTGHGKHGLRLSFQLGVFLPCALRLEPCAEKVEPIELIELTNQLTNQPTNLQQTLSALF